MSEYVSRQCPNCGGQLSVSSNALSLKCEHCGVEHMIRREAGGVVLESYARCPVCNRNDKVEKVTAILRSQTHSSEGITFQTQTAMVRVGETTIPVTRQVPIPVRTSQMSELAKHLTPPSKPAAGGMPVQVSDNQSHAALTSGILLAVLGGLSLLALICLVVTAIGSSYSYGIDDGTITGMLCTSLLSAGAIGGSILLFVFSVPRERKSNEQKRDTAARQRKELAEKSGSGQKRWQGAMERWNRLYYCNRDDCVFLPGENTSAPIGAMLDYLYQ
ncbi:MAG: hypothetical protein FJZ96_03875 [Chloroflexi bacterium]|nr:hypothetical protein [Chloroflexota bacterium]